MRKLLTFLIALAAVAFGICSPASAQCSRMGGGVLVCNPAPAAGGSPAYVFRNTATVSGSDSTNIITASIDIGTASADRLVVVGAVVNGGSLATSVVVNGVTLNADNNATGSVAIFSGLVTTGSGPQTVTVTWVSASFQTRGFALWTLTGLSSNVVKNIGAGSGQTGTINVTAGDLMFGVAVGTSGTGSWTGSTQSPAATELIVSGQSGADWTIASTNASFSLNSTIVGGSGMAAATYR